MADKYTRRKVASSSITTVVSISLVLFMLGLLGLLVLNTNKLSDYVKENIGFQVILRENAKEVDIARLQKMLDASGYVKSTEFIDKSEAEKRFKENVDPNEDFITFLDGRNPLPSSIDVHLKSDYANQDSISWIEKDLLLNKEVKEVWYQKSLVEMVNKNVKKIALIIVGFSGLLMIIALALINNTIRLSIYSRRFLIRTMQLVGATQGFIRKPFIFTGIQHGLLGSVISILMLIGVLYIAEKQIPELVQLQDLQLIMTLFGLVMFFGILITGISTYFAVSKYLRLKTDELYK